MEHISNLSAYTAYGLADFDNASSNFIYATIVCAVVAYQIAMICQKGGWQKFRAKGVYLPVLLILAILYLILSIRYELYCLSTNYISC